MTQTNEIASNRVQVTIHKDQKCPMCGEVFLTDQQTIEKPILQSQELGTVHEYCFLPYHKESELKLFFQIRCWSIGDTLATTPVIREIRRLYPSIQITVMTFYPDLFKNNPHINAIADMNFDIPKAFVNTHQFILDGFNSERGHHFAMHSVDFSAQSALNRSLLLEQKEYELYYDSSDSESMIRIIREHGIDPDCDKIIVLHPHATEWQTRDWGPHHMPDLARRLAVQYPKHKLVSIGGKRTEAAVKEMKNYVSLPPQANVVDLYGKLSLLQTAAFLDLPAIKLLVTPDTGTLHLAATRPELPIVGIFTLIKAEFRTPVRNKTFGYKFIGVESDSKCNCTFNTRFLTTESNFNTCPKFTFLDHMIKMNIPKPIKALGLYNLVKSELKDFGSDIRRERTKYSDPKNLPCFPSVEKVFQACQKLLGDTE